MIIYCRRKACKATIAVDALITGFSATERGFEPIGSFKAPPPPWRSFEAGGYLCSGGCGLLVTAGELHADDPGAR
jgi:hypothetical protein